ncbi:MAG: hypothetical protein ABSD64_13615 [Terriglobales bacterium]|jgi:hypothetical protein
MPIRDASVTLFLVAALVAASYGQDKKPSVVLPEGEAKHLAKLCSRPGLPKFDATWQPTETDVRDMESQLSRISLLQGSGVPSERRIDHPDQYFRQYVGIVVGKRKLIYINAFCMGSPADWRKRAVDVCDGDTCFWGVLYDTTTREFSDLEINGTA